MLQLSDSRYWDLRVVIPGSSYMASSPLSLEQFIMWLAVTSFWPLISYMLQICCLDKGHEIPGSLPRTGIDHLFNSARPRKGNNLAIMFVLLGSFDR